MPQNFVQSDPRIYQILALSSLLLMAVTIFDIQIIFWNCVVILISAVCLDVILVGQPCDRIKQIPSALISALSLCLLLRTTEIMIAVLAALVAIGSKRLLAYKGQHLFNPTAFSLVVITCLFDNAWISPGQWGQSFYLLILVVGAGAMVSGRAARLDISLGFLVSYGFLCFGRAMYLGDPASIPVHQLSSGALLIFAFFMISDPRTTPRSRFSRLVFALLVAIVAACVSFVLYRPNGPLYALVLCAPIVPLLNRYLPGERYSWPGFPQPNPGIQTTNGVHHA